MDWRSSIVRWKAALVVFLMAVALLDVWALSRVEIATSSDYHGSLHVTLSPRHRGWWPVAALQGNSPLSAAGVEVGDAIRFDEPADARRILERGESIGLSVRTRSGTRHIVVKAASDPVLPHDLIATATAFLVPVLLLFVGGLIGWRGAYSLPLRALAASLLSQTLLLADLLPPGGGLQHLLLEYAPIGTFEAAYVCFMYFALHYARWPLLGERRGRLAYRIYVAAFTAWALLEAVKRLAPESVFGGVSLFGYAAGLALFSGACSILVLVVGWRRAEGARRERLAWVVACLGTIYATYFVNNVALLVGGEGVRLVVGVAQGLLICAGNGGLAYAVLRHRVLDFGFAVNRAMVYGTTSLLLAATFMLLSQLANRVIEFEGRKAHHLLDVTIGLALALGARQAVKWVDPRVQRIFFRKWHAAAAKLAAFRIDSIHGRDPREIRSEFLQAVRDYSGVTELGFYLAASDGALACTDRFGHDLPAALDPGAPLVQALDASIVAIDVPPVDSTINAALALPMKAHGRTVGAVLLGPKLDGEPFRPDERKQLALTAQQVGLELELARLRALELQVSTAMDANPSTSRTTVDGAG